MQLFSPYNSGACSLVLNIKIELAKLPVVLAFFIQPSVA